MLPLFKKASWLAIAVLAASASGCHPPASAPVGSSAPTAPVTESAPPPDQQVSPLLPDPHLTPGATLEVTTDDICVPGYTKQVRNVPVAVKRQVYAEYGITDHAPGEYEVDHLISLELGGSNSIKNLWPQSYQTQPWNAHVKDALEDELHRLVCAGQLDLKTAQHDIASDWIGAYKQYFHTDQPLTSSRSRGHRERFSSGERSAERARPSGTISSEGSANESAGTESGADHHGQIWVNTRSGKYFFPGSRYYGRTKEGEYLTEVEARRQGYVAARGD